MTLLAALGFFFLGVIVTILIGAFVYFWIVNHLFPDKDIRAELAGRWRDRKRAG